MSKLRYLGYSIVFQEVPNEVSLAINISGCPHKCEGCHSKYLWEDIGNYLTDDLEQLIEKYKDLITCVCFMGGEKNSTEIIWGMELTKKYKLKSCLYTGEDNCNKIAIELLQGLDYLKIGHYDRLLGGLNSPTTNQKFFSRINGELIDTTYLFQNGR